jgi:hypothetical protein
MHGVRAALEQGRAWARLDLRTVRAVLGGDGVNVAAEMEVIGSGSLSLSFSA